MAEASIRSAASNAASPAGRPEEQRGAQGALHRRDTPANRGLVDMQRPRGPAQCLLPSQGEEDPGIVPIHRLPS
jgi:hypothetical protein